MGKRPLSQFGPLSWSAPPRVSPERDRSARKDASEGLAALWAEDEFDALLLVGLIAGLAWAPFWLGGNRLLAWGVDGVIFPALVLLFELRLLVEGRRHPVSIRWLAGPAALFAAALGWIVFQSLPFASGALAHPIWGMAGEVLGRPIEGSISVDRGQTLLGLLRLVTAVSVFWLAVQLSRKAPSAHLLLQAIALVVAGYSAYGLVLSAAFSGAIPLFDAPEMGLFVRSTFVNRNNFATYAGLGLVTTLALILRLVERGAAEGPGAGAYGLARALEASGRSGAILLAAAFVIFVALLGSVSRGGVLATALGVVALFALLLWRRWRESGARAAAVGLVAVGLAGGAAYFGDLIAGRFASAGLDDDSRLSVFAITARAILDMPLLGFGYGAFADVFPLYRDQSIPTAQVWDKAHNVYLEVWLGLGLLFGTALIAALVWLAARCLLGAIRRRQNSTPAAAAAACSLLVGAHALVDFGVQIEGVALTFMAILGAGVAQAESSRVSLAD